MLRALLYLRLTSLRNWTTSRALRLRQPKYLFGAIVGVAYFYFFFFRPLGAGAGLDGEEPLMLPGEWLPIVTAIAACVLLFCAVCMWIVPTERAALGFTEAEIAFLFPAPITRRGLIHFRLLSAQFRSLAGAVLMTLFSNRWTFLGGNPATHAIGWWFIFSALNLHLTGARFTLTRLTDIGVAIWRRRVLVALALAAVVSATWSRLPELAMPRATTEHEADVTLLVTRWLLPLAQTAPLSWLLWPFHAVLGPFLAADAGQFALALAPAAAVLILHYLWVVHSAVAFEEASVEQGEKRAARLAAWRAGQGRLSSGTTMARRDPFRLAARGRPELAFLWKNLLSTWPYFTPRAFLITAAFLTGVIFFIRSHPLLRELLPGIGAVTAAFAVYTLLVGPQFARQDIRADLVNADTLKTYPLAGWQIVLGQLLTPVAILTGILWLALLMIALSFELPGRAGAITLPMRIAAASGLALVAPVAAALQLLVPNAAALVFPGWYHATRGRGGGPEVIGQRMIFFFAQVLTMALALAPAVVLGGTLIVIVQWLLGPVLAVILAAIAVLAVLLIEVAAGIWLLGRRFEQLDLSAELRA